MTGRAEACSLRVVQTMNKTTRSPLQRKPAPIKITKPDGTVEFHSGEAFDRELSRVLKERRRATAAESANMAADGTSYRAVRLRELGFASYEEYLHSDLWRSVRNNFLTTTKNYQCFVCGDTFRVLHHTDYRNLGQEKQRDLIPLCDICHSGVHALIDSLVAQKRPIKLRDAHVRYRDSYRSQKRKEAQDEKMEMEKIARRSAASKRQWRPKKKRGSRSFVDPEDLARRERISKKQKQADDNRHRSEAAEAREKRDRLRRRREALRLERERLGRQLTQPEAMAVLERASL